jgi:hypothetical protein
VRRVAALAAARSVLSVTCANLAYTKEVGRPRYRRCGVAPPSDPSKTRWAPGAQGQGLAQSQLPKEMIRSPGCTCPSHGPEAAHSIMWLRCTEMQAGGPRCVRARSSWGRRSRSPGSRLVQLRIAKSLDPCLRAAREPRMTGTSVLRLVHQLNLRNSTAAKPRRTLSHGLRSCAVSSSPCPPVCSSQSHRSKAAADSQSWIAKLRRQFFALSTSLFFAIQGIMARRSAPTASIGCSALRRRVALKLGWPA